ncbi:MAG TPA: hypothetical protein PKI75_01355 [Candidatus Woesebacteria bacterium]|nr:hypothetical protein [Candidatus Woesebacteria bacterium]
MGIVLQVGALVSFAFQAYTTARFVGNGIVDWLSLSVGGIVNLLEYAGWFIILSTVAPRANNIARQWGFEFKEVKVERFIDSLTFVFLIGLYIVDAWATFQGCPEHWNDVICIAIAVGQTIVFELLINVGRSMMDEAVVKQASVDEAKEPAVAHLTYSSSPTR